MRRERCGKENPKKWEMDNGFLRDFLRLHNIHVYFIFIVTTILLLIWSYKSWFFRYFRQHYVQQKAQLLWTFTSHVTLFIFKTSHLFQFIFFCKKKLFRWSQHDIISQMIILVESFKSKITPHHPTPSPTCNFSILKKELYLLSTRKIYRNVLKRKNYKK